MIALEQRRKVFQWVEEAVQAGARRDAACAVLGLSVRSLQRWVGGAVDGALQIRVDRRPQRVQQPGNALTLAERQAFLAAANSPEYGHLPPSQIVPRLADTGVYIASEATLYRLLRAAGQLTHRRAERPAKARTKPRALSATAPNQLVSWDITYLPTLVHGMFLYLYVFLDVFSRKIVAWQVHTEESQDHASALVRDYVERTGIAPGALTLHSDNGAPMKGATLLATLQWLGVARSFSRPAVSNDNPYSEATFRTLKYRPDYPIAPFADLSAARVFVERLVRWYNDEHRHSAIGYVTPAQRHDGADQALLEARHQVYQKARARHRNRWSGQTRNWSRTTIVHLNPQSAGPGGAARHVRSGRGRDKKGPHMGPVAGGATNRCRVAHPARPRPASNMAKGVGGT
jgi:putative transposase